MSYSVIKIRFGLGVGLGLEIACVGTYKALFYSTIAYFNESVLLTYTFGDEYLLPPD